MRYLILPFFPRFITPNHVTVLRFILTPFIIWLFLAGNLSVGIPLFLFAALTDAIDGSMARMLKQVTEWGTFFDPVADKLLIGSIVLIMVVTHVSLWFALAIVFLELMIAGGGIFMKGNHHMVSANIWGKLKMLFQVVGVTLLMFGVSLVAPGLITAAIAVLSVGILLGIVSLLTYSL